MRASWLGAIAGVAAFAGMIPVFTSGLLGGLVWLVSTIAMSLWPLWLGVALARSHDSAVIHPE